MGRGAWGLAALAAALALAAPAEGRVPEPEDGWAQRALGIQFEVASDVGWTNMPWVGTHNSYNSVGQTGVALSSNDANQLITNVEQLDAGIRSLELDVHRFPDVPGGPLRVCHARGADQGHLGCTTEKALGPTLAEIAAWLDLPENSDEVLLLYLEDHMGDTAGYNAAADTVNAQLGDRLYKPPPGGCSEVPATLTRDDISASGAQAIIVSDCGPDGAAGWHGVAHNWNSHLETRPVNYEDFPSCGPDYELSQYESLFVRYYEDRTALTNQVGPPTGVATPDDGMRPATTAAMTRCGVDLLNFDLIRGPDDRRLVASVWSWQVNRPRPGRKGERDCAVQRRGVEVAAEFGFPGSAEPPTRPAWFDHRCKREHPTACLEGADVTAPASWVIDQTRRTLGEGRRACREAGGSLYAPRTGYEAQALDAALAEAGERQAWIGMKRRGGTWDATEPPGPTAN